MSNPESYTIGWICALSTELTAVQAFFDERHAKLAASSHNDTNDYELGRIGMHNIVVAVLPKSQYGLVNAATVAKDMTRTFPNIRFGLLVGVGGGAPSKKHDIRLGDIVVSTRTDGHGGIVQYDFGRREQGQEFKKTGSLNQPPQALLSALGGLESQYELEGHQLVASIEAALDRRPRLRKKYSRPGQHTDCLYRSHIIHPAGLDECGDRCGADPTDLVDRTPRGVDEDNPAIHFGLVGSANTVLKDAVLRDDIVAQEGVLCFEMEAAGLMNHFPCLVIRGICDYCDSHKNKHWQGFAAMMAAAYAKDLLLRVSPMQVQQEKLMSEAIASEVGGKVDRLHQTTSAISDDVFNQRIEHWLSAPDPSSNLNRARKLRHEGTGSWLLQNPTLERWLSGSGQGLWLHGLSGSGKTILSVTILDHLEKEYDKCIARFFFDFNETAKQTLEGMLRSFALQLHSASHRTRACLDALFRAHQDGRSQPSMDTLSNVVCQMLASQAEVVILIDALDESSTRNEVVQWLHEVTNRPELNHVRLFCTSRPEVNFVDTIPRLFGAQNCLDIDEQAVNTDIRAFVAAELQTREQFLRNDLPKDLVRLIQDVVGNKAKGMFRWAACQLDALASCLSITEIKAALQDLPHDLGETYQRMIKSIPESFKSDSARLFQFLVFSEHPLTLSEANDVIATRINNTFQGFSVENRVLQEAYLLKYCPGLVFIKPTIDHRGERDELHFTHLSVKEFLMRQPICDPETASIAISRTCLTYLQNIQDNSFPFARSAAQLWPKHVAKAGSSKDLTHQALAFLRDEVTFQLSLRLYQPDRGWDTSPGPPRGSKLYYGCCSGLVGVVIALLEDKADVNAQGGEYGNALQAASNGGHIDIVRLLLEKDADVNAQGGHYGNALQAASDGGHFNIVRLLLEKDADVNAQGGEYGNALQATSNGGHIDIVRLLLEKDADVNAQGGRYGNALQTASSKGYIDIVRYLLERNADVNAQGGHYGNALQAASDGGHFNIVRLLLEKDADVNAQGGRHSNALQAASSEGYIDIVRYLLERNADVNAQGGLYGNALQAASDGGHFNIVRLLLEKDADINAQGGRHGNALQATSSEGHIDIVRYLLERNADVNAQGGHYGNALQAASDGGHLDIVRHLLEKDADVNAQGGRYGNALQAASSEGYIDIVRHLLERNADVNAQGGRHGNALQTASSEGHIDIVRYLLERNADVNAQGGHYGNALQAASDGGHLDIVRHLLERNADVNAQGGRYGNALQAASDGGHIDIVRHLLERNADVNAQGGHYGNALQAASNGGYIDIVRLLNESGAI